MVGASQQPIDLDRIGAGGGVLAKHGQVGRNLTVEQSQLTEFGAGKLAEAAGVGLRQQDGEPVPVGAAFCDPLVGEDLSHGRGQGPEFRSA